MVLCHQGRFAEALLWFVRFQLICSELLLMPCHAEPFRGKLCLFLGASQLVMDLSLQQCGNKRRLSPLPIGEVPGDAFHLRLFELGVSLMSVKFLSRVIRTGSVGSGLRPGEFQTPPQPRCVLMS